MGYPVQDTNQIVGTRKLILIMFGNRIENSCLGLLRLHHPFFDWMFCYFNLEHQTKTAIYVNLGKAIKPHENVWLSISGRSTNVESARKLIQEKLDNFY